MCPVWGIKDAWPTEFVKVEAPQNKTEPSLQAGVAPIKKPKLPEGVGDSQGLAEGAARYTKRGGEEATARKGNSSSSDDFSGFAMPGGIGQG